MVRPYPRAPLAASSVWPVLTAITFNLTRAAGTPTSVFHSKINPGRGHPAPQASCYQAVIWPTTGRGLGVC
jgi:hypothetical protein